MVVLNDFFNSHNLVYFFIVLLKFLYNQCRVGTAKAKRVAEIGVKLHVNSGLWNIDVHRCLIRLLEVEVCSDKVVLHHKCRVDNLACTRHPHLVSGERLCWCHIWLMLAKDLCDSLSLVHIANRRRCCVGVDILNLLD